MDYYNINIIFSLWKYSNSILSKNEVTKVEKRAIIKSPISIFTEIGLFYMKFIHNKNSIPLIQYQLFQADLKIQALDE